MTDETKRALAILYEESRADEYNHDLIAADKALATLEALAEENEKLKIALKELAENIHPEAAYISRVEEYTKLECQFYALQDENAALKAELARYRRFDPLIEAAGKMDKERASDCVLDWHEATHAANYCYREGMSDHDCNVVLNQVITMLKALPGENQ